MQNLTQQFNLLRITRENVLSVIDGLSLAQMHLMPAGFNNNLVWNFGHLVVTQQLLCYKLSGITPQLSPEIIDQYKKGTAPQGTVSQAEFDQLAAQFLSNVDRLEKDYKEGLFQEFKEYPTSYNVVLNSVEDAIQFNNLHEALHLGSMMALKRNI